MVALKGRLDCTMLEPLLDLARSVGWGAADILRTYYRSQQDLNVQIKGSEPVTVADLAANQYILERLQQELGGQAFGYLSEETHQPGMPSYPQSYVWIIDPLDGTRDFIQRTGEYAIHIALVSAGQTVLAVVVWPEAEKLYFATRGGGAFVEQQATITPLKVSKRDRPEDLRLIASRSHRNERLNQLLHRLPQQSKTFMGSVGCKVAAIAEQQAEVYLSLSTTSAPKDWDLAAPELILTEAGGKFTHFDLTPLQYNQGDVNQWRGFLASNGPCHQQLCWIVEEILADLDRESS